MKLSHRLLFRKKLLIIRYKTIFSHDKGNMFHHCRDEGKIIFNTRNRKKTQY